MDLRGVTAIDDVKIQILESGREVEDVNCGGREVKAIQLNEVKR